MISVSIKTEPKVQKKNEKEWPAEYSCNFLEAGIVSYEDSNQGITYLTKQTIEKMSDSFVGKPVILDHHDVTPETFKTKAVGYVTRVWFNPDDGWFHCSFLLTDDKAKELVSRGYSVSCAFDVLSTGPGGEWHAIAYQDEILDGQFTHLAIVSNPRYEGCRIYHNSKGAGTMKIENSAAEREKIYSKIEKLEEEKRSMATQAQLKEVDIKIKALKEELATWENSKENAADGTKFKKGDKVKTRSGKVLTVMEQQGDSIVYVSEESKKYHPDDLQIENSRENSKTCVSCGYVEKSGTEWKKSEVPAHEGQALCPECGAPQSKKQNAKASVGDTVHFHHDVKNKDLTGVVTNVDGSDLLVQLVDGSSCIVKAKDVKQVFNSRENAADPKITKLAEDILEHYPTPNESQCVSYALEKGFKKYDGQLAWIEIHREMRSMNNSNVSEELMDPSDIEIRWPIMSDRQRAIVKTAKETVKKVSVAVLRTPFGNYIQDMHIQNSKELKCAACDKVIKDEKNAFKKGDTVYCCEAHSVKKEGRNAMEPEVKCTECGWKSGFSGLAVGSDNKPQCPACKSKKIKWADENAKTNGKSDSSVIFLNRTQKTSEKEIPKMFKFFFKNKKNEKIETAHKPEDVLVDVGGGKQVSVKELLNSKNQETLSLEDTFTDAEGVEHNVKELVEHYNSKNAKDEDEEKKENAADDKEEKKENEYGDDEGDEEEMQAKKKKAAKKNADDEDKEEKKENAKKAAKKESDFEKVKALRENSMKENSPEMLVDTMSDKCSRGDALFGKRK